jgi:DNA-binding IclR family transcriptional regulator
MLRAAALARQVNEAVWVAVLTENDVMVVHHEFRPDDVVQILEVGATIPWHACALGHAIAAYIDEETLRTLMSGSLRALTGRTHTTKAAMLRTLGKVRANGYAVENQESNVGEAGIAAPIVDRRGISAGSIGVVGPFERLLTPSVSTSLGRAVVETARAISRDMSGRRLAVALDDS